MPLREQAPWLPDTETGLGGKVLGQVGRISHSPASRKPLPILPLPVVAAEAQKKAVHDMACSSFKRSWSKTRPTHMRVVLLVFQKKNNLSAFCRLLFFTCPFKRALHFL